ncbi:hypothetical protein PUR71_06160 [Streptomyces sp. SP17BM10]|uniref:hypothetical protein n=1 Tax=Streptomyces sp. SP17BM10 TaxID=3002530 RepID=UPI002E7AA046|nr:hypothetical protein [Streptomyces sp. SP17BM10]MEE1782506.1 hypothetical protein [Streptomyces sp. SP17BM10]
MADDADENVLAVHSLLGNRLLRVTTARRQDPDTKSRPLLNLWLHLEGLGRVRLHTPGAGLWPMLDESHEASDVRERVTVTDDPSDVPLAAHVGQVLRGVRDIGYQPGRDGFVAGLTLVFPGGAVRLLAPDGDLVVTDVTDVTDVADVADVADADATLARVVQTCSASPSQWDAWTTTGRYLYLRYRHGNGSVELQPSEDVDTWDGEGYELRAEWDDGTGGGSIDLADFLSAAGLRLAADAEVS